MSNFDPSAEFPPVPEPKYNGLSNVTNDVNVTGESKNTQNRFTVINPKHIHIIFEKKFLVVQKFIKALEDRMLFLSI